MPQPTKRQRKKGSYKYTEELGTEICELLVEYSTRQVAAMEGMPTAQTMRVWANTLEDFREKYIMAINVNRTQHYLEQMIEISDNLLEGDIAPVDVNIARLRVEARDKALARMAPKKHMLEVESKNLNANLELDASDPQAAADAYMEIMKSGG